MRVRIWKAGPWWHITCGPSHAYAADYQAAQVKANELWGRWHP